MIHASGLGTWCAINYSNSNRGPNLIHPWVLLLLGFRRVRSTYRTTARIGRHRFVFGVAVVSALMVPCFARADEASREAAYRDRLLPLLRTYCFDCHGADGDGEVTLNADASAAALQKNRKLWTRALGQVRLGTMPPADGEMMDAATRASMVELMDELVNAVDCVRHPNAGKVALRRLNRNEYRNTVRDLTGVDYEQAEAFPGDDVGYGFDNIGDVLSLPPLLVEKYLDAAEVISGRAIYTPPPPQIFEIDRSPGTLKGAEKYRGGSQVTMASQGTVSLEVEAPFNGNYVLTVTASGDQGGDEPCRMDVVAGKFKEIVDVPSKDAKDYAISLRLSRGKRTIDLSFTNDYYVEGKVDRNLHLHHVHLKGTEQRSGLEAPPVLPASHNSILFVKPTKKISVEQATATVTSRLASRAFRRPASQGEVERLSQLAASVRTEGGSYEESMQVVLQAILVSPHFLYRVEQPLKPSAQGTTQPINMYELATRISYFLWSSMPDDELLLLAHRGELRDRKKLLDKVGRMIMDRRANQFVENFAGQWLQLRNLDSVKPDATRFRGFDDSIRELLERETLTFFAGVMRKNLPVTSLLDANFTYLNEDLAKYYGIVGVTGKEFRLVSLDGSPRGGLLTHASVLTVTSNPGRTSPVKRGKWILENLLNTPPPPAPPNVPELEKGKLVGTLRQRMEQHRSNPACAACHSVMDQLGFALENFDAVGRWRTRDGKDEIDASGELPDGATFNGVEELRHLLVQDRREQFVRCLAEKMLIYATGRGTEYYDKCAIDKIMADAQSHQYKFAYLIAAIIQSDPFQQIGHREEAL